MLFNASPRFGVCFPAPPVSFFCKGYSRRRIPSVPLLNQRLVPRDSVLLKTFPPHRYRITLRKEQSVGNFRHLQSHNFISHFPHLVNIPDGAIFVDLYAYYVSKYEYNNSFWIISKFFSKPKVCWGMVPADSVRQPGGHTHRIGARARPSQPGTSSTCLLPPVLSGGNRLSRRAVGVEGRSVRDGAGADPMSLSRWWERHRAKNKVAASTSMQKKKNRISKSPYIPI